MFIRSNGRGKFEVVETYPGTDAELVLRTLDTYQEAETWADQATPPKPKKS